jgi:carbon monoxide dehydrogenase subunit G
MVRFEGDRGFTLPPDQLWSRLSDARFLIQCLPDVESVSVTEPDRAVLVLRPGLAFVRGLLDLTLQVTEKKPPESARFLLTTRGIGSSSTVAAQIHLTPTAVGSDVHWTVEVQELGGLLKMVPAGLIRGAAEKVINDVWKSVAAQLDRG